MRRTGRADLVDMGLGHSCFIILRSAFIRSTSALDRGEENKDRSSLGRQPHSKLSPTGILPKIVEHENHPWFIGVQYHPELKSKPFEPHPLL